MAGRVDRTERLLNLVIALMATTRAVPRHVIRDEVPGYREAASDSAFERMFERDKDELRSMGIPVETVVDEFGETLGYRVPRDAYDMPPIDLTVAERNAIAVAAHVWGQASVAPIAGTALRKLESLFGDTPTWLPTDLVSDVALTSTDAALLPLMEAIRTDRAVSFTYRSPTSTAAETRLLSPWRLTSSQGHWRVDGYDHDRGAERTFRLSRIVGSVSLKAQRRVALPSTPAVTPDSPEADVRARVAVTPRRGAGLRRAACPDALLQKETGTDVDFDVEEFTVCFASLEQLMSAVLAAGADARVVEPPEIVDEVRARLAVVLGQHEARSS